MRLFRRHRGSQSEAPTPAYKISIIEPGATPAQISKAFTLAFTGHRPSGPLTARQALTATARQVFTAALMRDEMLAEEPDQVATIVKDIFMDLQENGLEIVASAEVEDAPEVLGRARQDRPPGW